jgi:hypothetical protein
MENRALKRKLEEFDLLFLLFSCIAACNTIAVIGYVYIFLER